MAHVKGYRGSQGGWNQKRGFGGYTLNQLNRVLTEPKQKRSETEAQRLARLERVRRYEESLRG
jgi:hypothetical protein